MHVITNIDKSKIIQAIVLVLTSIARQSSATVPAAFGISHHFSTAKLSVPKWRRGYRYNSSYSSNGIKNNNNNNFFHVVGKFNVPKRTTCTRLHGAKVFDNEKITSMFQIFNAGLLIAGTTIGGGFLALPKIVSRAGFVPSTVTIICVWFYFLAQSFALVECINRTKKYHHDQDNSSQDDASSAAPGVTAVVKSIYGTKGEVMVGILLAILIEATLVSQISRAGMLFSNYRLGCLISAFSVACLVFGPKSGIIFASKANAVLTSLFLLSTLTVFRIGFGIADWSQIGMLRNWSMLPSVLPTFLQLLVYGEILPTVCQILKYNTRYIHAAIVLGSFMTLCLQIGWSGLGTSLVVASSIETVAPLADPVAVLLSRSGPVRLPLFFLAITAILTTILGSFLALLSTYNDFVNVSTPNVKLETSNCTENTVQKEGTKSLVQRWKAASIIAIPSSLIACTSPSVFLKAIDFAGSYPVLLLWGVLPPLMVLHYRSKMGHGKSSSEKKTAGPFAWIVLLELVSLLMVGMNVGQDVSQVWINLKKL